MHSITVTNVNQALTEGLNWLLAAGVESTSRNGSVIVSPVPVCTTYRKPTERVLFSPQRDCNPYFHLMEALWMLAGRNDVAWPVTFNSKFGQFSDNGSSFWGAYGFRWRKWFGYDQLSALVAELKRNPDTRRCVLTMWDGEKDLDVACGVRRYGDAPVYADPGKDVPCNTHAYFDCMGSKVNMTVCCRSNDVLWGAYGANAVHFSVLLEYVAAAVGLPVGVYRQFSNNYHTYTATFSRDKQQALATDGARNDYYEGGLLETVPLVNTPLATWHADLFHFLEDPDTDQLEDMFFLRVAQPMYRSWMQRKNKQGDGKAAAAKIWADDWRCACLQWLERRKEPLHG